VGPRAPDRNAVAERWVQGVKRECLDRSAVSGEAHLWYLLQERLAWYHACRPHQGPGNRPLNLAEAALDDEGGQVALVGAIVERRIAPQEAGHAALTGADRGGREHGVIEAFLGLGVSQQRRAGALPSVPPARKTQLPAS
jgi:hypothetical protein